MGCYVWFVGSWWKLGVALAPAIQLGRALKGEIDLKVPVKCGSFALRTDGEDTGTVGVAGRDFCSSRPAARDHFFENCAANEAFTCGETSPHYGLATLFELLMHEKSVFLLG
jgi:hypothetical protein